jgi:hypothetical protein
MARKKKDEAEVALPLPEPEAPAPEASPAEIAAGLIDGLYFGLPDDIYHAVPALGSSHTKRLAVNPPDFWWQSWLNPNRPPDDPTYSMLFGRAVHTFILDGPAAFQARYGRAVLPGTTKAGREERALMRAAGQEPFRADDYDRIVASGGMIRANPHLVQAFSGGIPEVSVIWTDDDGIRWKARLDYLKPRAIVDLKSIRNSRQVEFKEACRRAFADLRYDVQAALYMEGRKRAVGFSKAGLTFGDHPLAETMLDAIEKVGDNFAFVFVFWQAENSPVSWGISLSPQNDILEVGRGTVRKAADNWKAFHEQFPEGLPWVIADPIEELDYNELPAWWAR